MSDGGADTPTQTYGAADPKDLAQFMNTAAGRQYANLYDPTKVYASTANGAIFYDPKEYADGRLPHNFSNADSQGRSVDVTPLMAAFTAWRNGNAQTQSTWQSYADKVAANGEGDATITSGAAQGQRQALLGALAGAGQQTTPTPGFGTMGSAADAFGRKK